MRALSKCVIGWCNEECDPRFSNSGLCTDHREEFSKSKELRNSLKSMKSFEAAAHDFAERVSSEVG